MPAYDFYCPHCLNASEHIFRMAEVPSVTTCACGALAYRQYTAPRVSCVVSQYSHVHGIDMANRSAVRDMQARYHDTTGNHLVEAGNENIHRTPPAPDWERVAREAKAMEGVASG